MASDKRGLTRDEIYQTLKSNGLKLSGAYTSGNMIATLDANGIEWGKADRVVVACPTCNQTFDPKDGKLKQGRDRKFCSAKCRKTQGGKRLLRSDPRPCNECGIIFTPPHGVGAAPKSCSEKCRENAQKTYLASDHYRLKILPGLLERSYEKGRLKTQERIKNCRLCNTEFKRPNAHYCSDICKITHRKELKKSYFQSHEVKIRIKKWRNQPHQKEKINKLVSKRRKERRQQDPIYLLKERIRCRTKAAFNGCGFAKGCKTRDMIGCSWEQFKAHIESQFTKKMKWSNKHLWDIDHIIPLASGTTEAELIKLSHFSNLRPLWRGDNLLKSDNIIDCQPELTLKHE